MSGLPRAVGLAIADLRRDVDAVVARLDALWDRMRGIEREQDASADRQQTLREDVEALRRPADVDLPSPPRAWAEIVAQVGAHTRDLEALFRRMAIVEGGAPRAGASASVVARPGGTSS